MTRLWARVISNTFIQKALEWAGGISVMLMAGVFSPTYWLMTLVLKPYFDLRTLFSSSNFLSTYIDFIHTLKHLGPHVLLLQILPLLCLCLLAGILYSITCTWLGTRITRRFISRNIAQVA